MASTGITNQPQPIHSMASAPLKDTVRLQLPCISNGEGKKKKRKKKRKKRGEDKFVPLFREEVSNGVSHKLSLQTT